MPIFFAMPSMLPLRLFYFHFRRFSPMIILIFRQRYAAFATFTPLRYLIFCRRKRCAADADYLFFVVMPRFDA